MNALRKTKIIATIGPSSSSEQALTRMMAAGMNVARINCTYGDHAEYRANIEMIRKIAKKMKVPIAILLDLSGPKIRLGEFSDGKITLIRGALFTLTTQKVAGTSKRSYVNYHRLTRDVKPGMNIKIDDGKIDLKVESISGKDVVTRVVVGGDVWSRRGVNMPDANLSLETIGTKDIEDIKFGVDIGVDFIALSFVRSHKDILELHNILSRLKSSIAIIAKIETQQAVKNIDAIIEIAPGVMIARGDLAVEVGKEEVPLIQKMIIKKCGAKGKVVITATQMLDSMVTSSTPTRAEVSDVANAIFDGTDAVMLSQESAIGIHPHLAIQTMAHIALKIENSELYRENIKQLETFKSGIIDAVSSSVAQIVRNVNAVAIVALTESGFSAHIVSRHKPIVPILAITSVEATYRHLALSYGCYPILISPPIRTMAEAVSQSQKALSSYHFMTKANPYVLVTRIPFGVQGGTNTLSVQYT